MSHSFKRAEIITILKIRTIFPTIGLYLHCLTYSYEMRNSKMESFKIKCRFLFKKNTSCKYVDISNKLLKS